MKRKGRVENKFLKRMKNDYTFRTFVFSSLSCFVTVAFAGYNAILAISYRSAWNTGIAVYYTLLSCIRIYVIFSERKFYKTGLDEQRKGMQRKKRFGTKHIAVHHRFYIDCACCYDGDAAKRNSLYCYTGNSDSGLHDV